MYPFQKPFKTINVAKIRHATISFKRFLFLINILLYLKIGGNMAKKNPNDKQIEYWTKRNEKLFTAGEKQGLKLAQAMKDNYEASAKRLTAELYIFFNQYAKEGNISLQDAKKLLDRKELKTFHKELKEFLKYAKQHNYDSDLVELRLLQLKVRVSRLDALRAQIDYELSKLADENENLLKGYLSNIYEEGYYRTIFNIEKDIGYELNFAKLNTKLIEKAVSRNYNLANYSIGIKKVWQNKDNLMTILNQAIPQGLTLGYNPIKIADITSKKLKTDYNATVRLMRTEYNLLMNDAISDGYKACGINQYKISATLDNKTSEICQAMDGEVFDVSKKEVGINYPPFHPNCRTTTIPYFEPDEIDKEFGIGTRIAKDKNGNYYKVPADMTYKEWKEKNL